MFKSLCQFLRSKVVSHSWGGSSFLAGNKSSTGKLLYLYFTASSSWQKRVRNTRSEWISELIKRYNVIKLQRHKVTTFRSAHPPDTVWAETRTGRSSLTISGFLSGFAFHSDRKASILCESVSKHSVLGITPISYPFRRLTGWRHTWITFDCYIAHFRHPLDFAWTGVFQYTHTHCVCVWFSAAFPIHKSVLCRRK